MRSALDKLFGSPDDDSLTARSYLSTVVHNELIERTDVRRKKRICGAAVKSRRQKAEQLSLRLIRNLTPYSTPDRSSLLNGFGFFSFRTSHGNCTLNLSTGTCNCIMRSQTCKNLMSFRVLWLTQGRRAVWADNELNTVLPRSQFSYPPVSAPDVPGCRARNTIIGLDFGGHRPQIPPSTSAAADSPAALPDSEAVQIPACFPTAAAKVVYDRMLAAVRKQSSQLLRLKKLMGLSATVSSTIEADFRADGGLLEQTEGLATLLERGVDSLMSALPALEHSARTDAAGPSTHQANKVLHRHSGSLPPAVKLNRKGSHPTAVRSKARKQALERALSDSDVGEDASDAMPAVDVRASVSSHRPQAPTRGVAPQAATFASAARLGKPESRTGKKRHVPSKKAALPHNTFRSNSVTAVPPEPAGASAGTVTAAVMADTVARSQATSADSLTQPIPPSVASSGVRFAPAATPLPSSSAGQTATEGAAMPATRKRRRQRKQVDTSSTAAHSA